MDSANKNHDKNQNSSQYVSYNPWNLFFNQRKRTESETSVTSTGSQNNSKSKFVYNNYYLKFRVIRMYKLLYFLHNYESNAKLFPFCHTYIFFVCIYVQTWKCNKPRV